MESFMNMSFGNFFDSSSNIGFELGYIVGHHNNGVIVKNKKESFRSVHLLIQI